MMPAHQKPWVEMLFHAPTLGVAKLVVSSWTWLYSLALPRDERESRRAEVLSDVHDQITSGCEEGIGAIRTSLHILGRMFWGLLDDVVWAGQQVPTALGGCLKRGSDSVGNMRPSPVAISCLAMLGLMNWTLAMSDIAMHGMSGSPSTQRYLPLPCFY